MSNRYGAALQELLKLRAFGQSDSAFRFAAVPWSRASLPPSRDAARPFEKHSACFFPFSLAASGIAAARGLDAGEAAARVVPAREALEDAGLSQETRSGWVGAVVLSLLSDGGKEVARRAARSWRHWKKDHSWLTGDDDFAMAVLHATLEGEPDGRAAATEAIYRGLHASGLSRTNTLQLAAQVGATTRLAPAAFLDRFALVAGALRDRGWALVHYRPVEVALLALCDGSPFEIARDQSTREHAQHALPRAPWPVEASAISALLVAQDSPAVPAGVVDTLALVGCASPLWA